MNPDGTRDKFMRAIDCGVALHFYGKLWETAGSHYPSPDRINLEPSRGAAFLEAVASIKRYQKEAEGAMKALVGYIEENKP